MAKITSIIAATVCSILAVTLVSVAWFFLPTLILSPKIDYFFGQLLSYSLLVLAVTGIIVCAIGIPVYYVLVSYGKASQKNLALIGFAIPNLILLALMLIFLPDGNGSYSSGQNYYGTYRDMVIENELTFWGWIRLMEEHITYGVYGLIGATIFGTVISHLSQPRENA